MNKLLLSLLLSFFLSSITQNQHCLNADGNPVAWWVQLVFPGSVPGGFAYFDATFTTSNFVIHN